MPILFYSILTTLVKAVAVFPTLTTSTIITYAVSVTVLIFIHESTHTGQASSRAKLLKSGIAYKAEICIEKE